MSVDLLRENDSYVESLQQAFHSGEVGLSNVPALVKRVIAEERWRRRYVRALGREVQFPSFVAFLGAKVPEGLGAELETIKRLCGNDPEARDAIDRATQNPSHRPVSGNNVPSSRPEGNMADKAIRRLRRDRPELHAQVLAGELTPHGAMIAAGFRPKTATVVLEPEKAARTLRRRFTDEEWRAFVRCVNGAE